MKHANVLWQKWAKEDGIAFRQVDFVHDEWQTEVPISRLEYDAKGRPFTAEARRLGELQCKAIEQVGIDLGIRCPLAGKSDFGFNWAETH